MYPGECDGTNIACTAPMKKRNKWLLGILIFIIGVRIALPYLVENRINKALSNIDGYSGKVDDVDLHLYRGAMKVKELVIYEEASLDPDIPIVDLGVFDFSIEWKALFKGRFVGECYMDRLTVNFTKREASAETDSTGGRAYLLEEIQKLNPITLNILEITNGNIALKDPSSTPPVDIHFNEFYLLAKNLANVDDPNNKLPAYLEVNAASESSGAILLKADLNYFKEIPDFDLDLEITALPLVEYNDFVASRSNVELEAGTFSLFAEIQAFDGKITGYAKPIINGLEVAPAEKDDGLLKKIYEEVLELGTEIIENRKEDQIATKVELNGDLNDVKVKPLPAILNILRNAFIEAYTRQLDYTLGFKSKDVADK